MPLETYLGSAKMPKDFFFETGILGVDPGHDLAPFLLRKNIHEMLGSFFRFIQTLLQMRQQTEYVQTILFREEPSLFYVFYRRMGNYGVFEAGHDTH